MNILNKQKLAVYADKLMDEGKKEGELIAMQLNYEDQNKEELSIINKYCYINTILFDWQGKVEYEAAEYIRLNDEVTFIHDSYTSNGRYKESIILPWAVRIFKNAIVSKVVNARHESEKTLNIKVDKNDEMSLVGRDCYFYAINHAVNATVVAETTDEYILDNITYIHNSGEWGDAKWKEAYNFTGTMRLNKYYMVTIIEDIRKPV